MAEYDVNGGNEFNHNSSPVATEHKKQGNLFSSTNQKDIINGTGGGTASYASPAGLQLQPTSSFVLGGQSMAPPNLRELIGNFYESLSKTNLTPPTILACELDNSRLVLSDTELQDEDIEILCSFLMDEEVLSSIESVELRHSWAINGNGQLADLLDSSFSANNYKLLKQIFLFLQYSKNVKFLSFESIHLPLASFENLGVSLIKIASTLKWLSFKHCNIGDEGLKILSQALCNISLQVLALEICNLSDKSIPFILSVIKASQVNVEAEYWSFNEQRLLNGNTEIDNDALRSRGLAVISLFVNSFKSSSLLAVLLNGNPGFEISSAQSLWSSLKFYHFDVFDNCNVNRRISSGNTSPDSHKLLKKLPVVVRVLLENWTRLQQVEALATNDDESKQIMKNSLAAGYSLVDAAANDRLDEVQILIQDGVQINFTTEDGNSPLIVAAESGQDAVVSFLINIGAFINQQNQDKLRAIIVAKENGHKKIVNLLEQNELTSSVASKNLFVAAYEALYQTQMPEINRNPVENKDHVDNSQCIIDNLSRKLKLDLSHITGQLLVEGDLIAIKKLVDIFFYIFISHDLGDNESDSSYHRSSKILSNKSDSKWNRSKVCMVGEGRAGKTAIVNTLLGMKFEDTKSTIGINEITCDVKHAFINNQSDHTWVVSSKAERELEDAIASMIVAERKKQSIARSNKNESLISRFSINSNNSKSTDNKNDATIPQLKPFSISPNNSTSNDSKNDVIINNHSPSHYRTADNRINKPVVQVKGFDATEIISLLSDKIEAFEGMKVS
eukprot:gene12322-16526_t